MKVSEFRQSLEGFARLFDGESDGTGSAIRELLAVFNGHETMTMAAFSKAALLSEPPAPSAALPTVRSVLGKLNALLAFCAPLARASFVTDLRSLIKLAERGRDSAIQEFVAAVTDELASKAKPKATPSKRVNRQVVDNYVSLLNDSYRQVETFESVYAKLKSDKAVRQQESAAIASKFAYEIPPSTPKKTALEIILSHHQHYIASELKEKAVSGRSAA